MFSLYTKIIYCVLRLPYEPDKCGHCLQGAYKTSPPLR